MDFSRTGNFKNQFLIRPSSGCTLGTLAFGRLNCTCANATYTKEKGAMREEDLQTPPTSPLTTKV